MLNIICALHCEARPLIDYFSLKANTNHSPYPIYSNENTQLIISGIGKIHSAGATSYLYQNKSAAWLNIGVAGHPTEDIGKGFLANKISDKSSGHHYYPGLSHMKGTSSLSLMTVDMAINDYPENNLYDMEASGFYPTASRFTSVELIQCYKVISDNPQNPTHQINKEFVKGLIENRIHDIEKVTLNLRKLADHLEDIHNPPENIKRFFAKWHFTQTETVILKNLLMKWKACQCDQPVWDDTLNTLQNTKSVLKYLEQKVNAQPLEF